MSGPVFTGWLQFRGLQVSLYGYLNYGIWVDVLPLETVGELAIIYILFPRLSELKV